MKHEVSVSETSQTDVADLRAFCLVVDLGSITAAAKALGETKGSVSRRLTRLERVLGVSLLRRTPRLVQATDDGAAYRVRIGRALELLDEANSRAQHARVVPSGHLRVTAPFDLAVSVFADIVAGFVAAYPEITIEMLLTEAFLDFDANQVDVALRAAGSLPDSSLIAHRLAPIEAGLFASPTYLEKHGRPRRTDDLAKHRLLMFRGTRGVATLALRRRDQDKPLKLRAKAAITASDFTFCKAAALAHGGIAMLPTLVARRELDEGLLVPVLKEWVLMEASLYLVHPATRFLLPKVRVFRDHVVAAFARTAKAR
jgi:DNA-binding transcriptional LysR family regulator